MKSTWTRRLSLLTACSLIVSAGGQISIPSVVSMASETTEVSETAKDSAESQESSGEKENQTEQKIEQTDAAPVSQTEKSTAAVTETTKSAETEGKLPEEPVTKPDVKSTETAETKPAVKSTEAAETKPVESQAEKAESSPEEKKESTEEGSTEKTKEESSEKSSPVFTQNVTVGGVHVRVKAEEGAFPEGTRLEAHPVDEKAVIDESQDLFQDRVVDAEAVDISFYLNGKQLQPEDGKVHVSLSLSDAVGGQDQHVVHIEGNGQAQVVPAVRVDDTSADFAADSFSIYAIVGTDKDGSGDDTENPNAIGRLTYLFYNGDQLVSRQIVKSGDILQKPQDPEKDGFVFLGWKERNTDKSDSGDDNSADAGKTSSDDDYFDDFGTVEGGDDDDTIILDAVFQKMFYVTFYNETGEVVRQASYKEGESFKPSDVSLTLQNNESNNKEFKGWSLFEKEEDRLENVIDKDTEIKVDQDLNLYPAVAHLIHVVFHEFKNDGGFALYNPAEQYIEDGGLVKEPDKKFEDPELLAGYEADGWTLDPNTYGIEESQKDPGKDQPYDFNKPVYLKDLKDPQKGQLDLYVIWKPKDEASYRVVIHREIVDPDPAVNAERHNKGEVQYSNTDGIYWDHSNVHKFTAKVGNTITADSESVKDVLNNLGGFGEISNIGYEPTKDPTKDYKNEKVAVTRDGRAVFDIYLDAKVYTLHFLTAKDGKIAYKEQNESTAVKYTPANLYDVTGCSSGEITFTARSGEKVSALWPDLSKIQIAPKSGSAVQGLVPYVWQNSTSMNYDTPDLWYPPYGEDGGSDVYYYLLGGTNFKKYTLQRMYQKVDAEDLTEESFANNGWGLVNGEADTSVTYGDDTVTFDPALYGDLGDAFTKIEDKDLPSTLKKKSVSGNEVDVYYYYKRNSFPLYLQSGDKVVAAYEGSAAIPYGKDVSDILEKQKEALNASDRPVGVPADYVVTGWWENQQDWEHDYWSMPSKTLILHAKWDKAPAAITCYDGVNEKPSVTEVYDYGYTLPDLTKPDYRPGYTFAGWKTKDGKTFFGHEKVTESITIYAQWYKKDMKVKVVYDAGEGSNAPTDEASYLGGSLFRVNGAPTAPEGRYFAGWKLGKDTFKSGELVELTPERADMAKAEGNDSMYILTLTAEYTDNIKDAKIVYFANNGSDQASSETVENNGSYTIRNADGLNFQKKGFFFAGWNTKADGSGTAYKAGDRVGVDNTSPNELYAQWSSVPVQEKKEESESESESEEETEETESETTNSVETDSQNKQTQAAKAADTSVKTGDTSPISLYLMLMCLAGGVIFGTGMIRRKRDC